jgi:phosphoribosylformimino-5-aminoimidazole carboxamide ribotide isomerase
VDRVVIGTRAVQDPEGFAALCQRFSGKIVAGIDAKEGRVATEGWLAVSSQAAIDLARRLAELPLAAIVYTDISRDGMLQGANIDALAELAAAVAVPVIASGGVTSLEDIRRLARLGLAGCIVGRALYEGRLQLADVIREATLGING